MQKLLPLILLLLTAPAFGQTSRYATATRAENGKLIGLTNILGLSDCRTTEVAGKVRKIKGSGEMATFQLWSDKQEIGEKKTREKRNVEVRLNGIAAADRTAMFKDMIRKSFRLRVAGYLCGASDTISAFSLDLIY